MYSILCKIGLLAHDLYDVKFYEPAAVFTQKNWSVHNLSIICFQSPFMVSVEIKLNQVAAAGKQDTAHCVDMSLLMF